MDIAVFVGFAASGPLQIPVAIESEAQFAAIFGALPIAVLVAAFAIPVVYIVYLYDVNLWEDEPVPVTALAFGLTGLLAALFTVVWTRLVPLTISLYDVNGFVIGNIYSPQTPLSDPLMLALAEANEIISKNVEHIGANLADIHGAFHGHEDEYLCYDIEPSHKGAAVIASLFKGAIIKAGGP